MTANMTDEVFDVDSYNQLGNIRLLELIASQEAPRSTDLQQRPPLIEP